MIATDGWGQGGRLAAVAEPGIGHRCATSGPRSFLKRWLGVLAKAAVAASWRPGIRTNEKSPPRSKPGGPGRRRSMLVIDPIGALAALRSEGLDGVSGLLHRAGHQPSDGVFQPTHLLRSEGGVRC